MRPIGRLYHFISILSIDVAGGAMISACFFARILGVTLLPAGIASMGVTVWIIYATDHLLDSIRLKERALTDRHAYYQDHKKVIIIFLLIAIVVECFLITQIRRPVLIWGLALALVVGIYLIIQKWISPLKEIAGALLYAGGVALPALSLTQQKISNSIALLLVVFCITALINLILFSVFDLDNDVKHSQSSFPITFGYRITRVVLTILFFAQLAFLSLLIAASTYFFESFILLMMNLILLVLFLFQNQFSQNDRYRIIGDCIFMFPIFYLLYGI